MKEKDGCQKLFFRIANINLPVMNKIKRVPDQVLREKWLHCGSFLQAVWQSADVFALMLYKSFP